MPQHLYLWLEFSAFCLFPVILSGVLPSSSNKCINPCPKQVLRTEEKEWVWLTRSSSFRFASTSRKYHEGAKCFTCNLTNSGKQPLPFQLSTPLLSKGKHGKHVFEGDNPMTKVFHNVKGEGKTALCNWWLCFSPNIHYRIAFCET